MDYFDNFTFLFQIKSRENMDENLKTVDLDDIFDECLDENIENLIPQEDSVVPFVQIKDHFDFILRKC